MKAKEVPRTCIDITGTSNGVAPVSYDPLPHLGPENMGPFPSQKTACTSIMSRFKCACISGGIPDSVKGMT